MLAQVRFAPIEDLVDAKVVEGIHGRVAERYPRRVEEQQFTIPPFVDRASTLVRLTDFAGDWSVVIARDFLTVETSGAYTVWEDVEVRMREALEALTAEVSITARERIGLRYVNEVRPPTPDTEWSTCVNRALLGLVESEVGPAIRQTVSEIQFENVPGVVALRHGLVAPDPSGERFYLIDIDCFDMTPAPFGLDEILKIFASFNVASFNLFRWSLTDEFYSSLRREAE